MREHELTDADFRELDELLEGLLDLRANPPDGVTADELPGLLDLAGGDPHRLALLEQRLEHVRARTARRDA